MCNSLHIIRSRIRQINHLSTQHHSPQHDRITWSHDTDTGENKWEMKIKVFINSYKRHIWVIQQHQTPNTYRHNATPPTLTLSDRLSNHLHNQLYHVSQLRLQNGTLQAILLTTYPRSPISYNQILIYDPTKLSLFIQAGPVNTLYVNDDAIHQTAG